MEQVKATRSELLQKKAQISLARQGRDLLKEKRNALMQELMRTAELAIKGGAELERRVGQAEALDGPEVVRSAALAARGHLTLDVHAVNLMGVTVPRIEQKSVARGPLDRGYSPLTISSRIEAAAEAFETLIDLVIQLAESEMRLRRLAEEIGRTTRRVNALDNVLIPRLEAQRNYIEMVLDEREREDLFRLKRVKQKIAR